MESLVIVTYLAMLPFKRQAVTANEASNLLSCQVDHNREGRRRILKATELLPRGSEPRERGRRRRDPTHYWCGAISGVVGGPARDSSSGLPKLSGQLTARPILTWTVLVRAIMTREGVGLGPKGSVRQSDSLFHHCSTCKFRICLNSLEFTIRGICNTGPAGAVPLWPSEGLQ